MLKKKITYEDFNGNKVEEFFYFNLSKPEIIEMEVEHREGFTERMNRIIEAKDNKALVKEFKEIVLLAYGEKSEDGRSFIKNDQLREQFSMTAAYQELFMELCLDDEAAADFIIGVVPKDMAEEALKQSKELLNPRKSTADIAAAQKDEASQ